MATIIVKTQAELDALPQSFAEFTYIEIRSAAAEGRISITIKRENSSVEAWGNSSVVARENSSVVAWENSSVVAWENSSVVARENSSVVAWENSSVVAWENSSVVARENSSVVAWENSSVEAWENSSVVAWENCCARLFSTDSTVNLHGYSVAFANAKGTIKKHSDKATIITPERYKDIYGWLEQNAVKQVRSFVVLFKRVSSDFRTQEGEPWETKWEIGSKLTHPAWEPATAECSAGKYHACSQPYFCDEFRGKAGDRYVAIKIKVEDLYAWIDNPRYPHKVAFKAGKVLHEVDRMGRKIEATA